MRRGFTMVETMVASAIGVIALLAIGSSFLAAGKMLHVAMAESELSLAMREMRDKILFKASPDVSGNHYGGLLSGKNLNEGDVRSFNAVEMGGRTVGANLGSTADSSLRLLVWTPTGGTDMGRMRGRRGVVLVTVLVMTGVCAVVLAAVIGYVSSATRMTAAHLDDSVCRLAAQSEIEMAKAVINDSFNQTIARGAHVIGTGVGGSICAFDWFGVGDSTTLTRTIGAQNGRGDAVTLDESSESCSCRRRLRARAPRQCLQPTRRRRSRCRRPHRTGLSTRRPRSAAPGSASSPRSRLSCCSSG